MNNVFKNSFSEEIWAATYKDHRDSCLDDTFRRVAKDIASAEETEEKKVEWGEKFYDLLSDFKSVSGGRIMANAGTEWANTTYANCYVGPLPERDLDSIEGIYAVLKDQANTLKSEGGWGMNFSWIRPRGAFIAGVGVESPGSVRMMELFDKSSEIVTSGSGRASTNKKAKGKIRKGAMMSVMDVWHPDVVEFITAKQTPGRLTKFNVSVNCTDEFMSRVNGLKTAEEKITGYADVAATVVPHEKIVTEVTRWVDEINELDKWDLIFPDTTHPQYKAEWDGNILAWKAKGYPVTVHNTVSVRWLWNLIMESTYNRNEPGVLFLDRANYFAPLSYAEKILATNPSMPAGTLVHTKSGIYPIDNLEGKEFLIKSMDGQWANAKCFLSGENEEVLSITLGSNKVVRSTKQHRWPVFDQRMGRVYKVYASDLKPGDLIPLNRNEEIGIYGDMTLTEEEGFFVGYLVGDGWYNRRSDNGRLFGGMTFGRHESAMAERLVIIARKLLSMPDLHICEKPNELYFQFSNARVEDVLLNRYKLVPGEKTIPDSVWCGNDAYIKGFVDGLLSADGHVSLPNKSIDFVTSREDLAKGYAKLLAFAGISSNLYTSTGPSSFPNGKDYGKDYVRWQVRVCGGNLVNFYNVFDITHDIKGPTLQEAVSKADALRDQRSRSFAEVKSVEVTSSERVWDISVFHGQHVFPAEWCYTGNCGEQTLAPGGVCCLGTLNLTQFVKEDRTGFDSERLRKYAGYLVRFLDNVNSISGAPLRAYKHSMTEKRRIGCGVMGWGSALFMMEVRFGSAEAGALREEMMSAYARATYEASIDLAEEKGKFSYCDPEKHADAPFVKALGLSDEYMAKLRRTGIRNSSLLSQQPNGNTSILANVVSGGIEPIFMPEYVRTVIVQNVPAQLSDVTPKYAEGQFHETKFFKLVKEGDDDILRGVDDAGTVWKIDRSRGLTKEVICEDYGVHYLKERGEWDASADWAVTTTQLTVADHVEDLRGFARWTDSACSKTCNIPHDYPFEDFKDLYLDVYNTGVIKGFTTYRAGTMASVLSAKDEKTAEPKDEEIILEDVQLPDSLPATLKTLRAEGRKWYLTVIQNESQTRPVALFVQTNAMEKSVTANDAVEKLLGLARSKGIPEHHIQSVIGKISQDNNPTKTCRVISLNLRHGVLIKSIVATLGKVDCYVGSFVFHIRKFLASLIKDGEKVADEKCLECGSESVVYQEGCKVCLNCGSSKCG